MIANDTGMARITIVVTGMVVLAVNIMLYRFLYERENLELKQQMNIYEQQIRSDINNNRQIQMIRHDMKHHIREIKELSEKGMTKEINEYIDMLAGDINEAQ